MYCQETSDEEIRLPNAYAGVAFREREPTYIDTPENRNPWEETKEEIKTEEPKGKTEPKKSESVFGLLKHAFPASDILRGVNLPSFFGKILPGTGKAPPHDDCREEENLMLLLVVAILFFSPHGDKKAAVMLLLVYLLA